MGIGLQGGDLSIEFVNDAVSANVPTRIYANPLVVLGGNVGIGTSSPTERLHLNNSSSTGTFIRFQDTSGGGVYIGGRDERMELYAGGAERMRITSGGAILLGTTTSDSGVTRLQVAPIGTSWISGTFAGTGNTDKIVIGNLGSSGPTIGGHNSTLTAWAAMSINPGGGAVYAGTLRIDNNSDQRIKRNITSVENALDTILQLQGRKFNMIDEDNILRYGFVAQEVQPVLSDFVTESNREHKDENVHITNLLTLETSGAAWAALLVEAIKELKADNDAIRAELAALKS
jgi:hypothetical protein